MDRYLEGKKVLFIAPKFFGYEKEIKKEMEKQGADVTYFSDNPFNNLLNSNFIKKFPKLRNFFYKIYFKYVIHELKETYQFCFVIKGDMIPLEFLEKLKLEFVNTFIMYQWDSIKRFPTIIERLNYFDYIFSFEKEDTLLYSQMHYLALFYLSDYFNLNYEESVEKNIDFLFIGSNHSDRLIILNKLVKIMEENKFSYYFHIQNNFIPYLKNVILDRQMRKNLKIGYTWKSLSKKKIIDLYKKSKVIIDIQEPNQRGITIRMIESLAAQKKVITTNSYIKNYDFYNTNNIKIISRNNPEFDFEILNAKYCEKNQIYVEEYSLKNWLFKIFQIVNTPKLMGDK